jgi:hypothetical protein
MKYKVQKYDALRRGLPLESCYFMKVICSREKSPGANYFYLSFRIVRNLFFHFGRIPVALRLRE